MKTAREIALETEVRRLRAELATHENKPVIMGDPDFITPYPFMSEYGGRTLPVALRVDALMVMDRSKCMVAVSLDNFQTDGLDPFRLESAIYLDPRVIMNREATTHALEEMHLKMVHALAGRLVIQEIL